MKITREDTAHIDTNDEYYDVKNDENGCVELVISAGDG